MGLRPKIVFTLVTALLSRNSFSIFWVNYCFFIFGCRAMLECQKKLSPAGSLQFYLCVGLAVGELTT